jgi:hypothetical protein
LWLCFGFFVSVKDLNLFKVLLPALEQECGRFVPTLLFF